MAPTLTILGGGAAHGLVQELAPALEREMGYAIDGTFDAVGKIAARMRAGARPDILVLTAALIAELTREGHLAQGSAAGIGSVETSVAVRAGDPVPAIDTADALRTALLGAVEIFFPDPQLATAGIHFTKVMDRLGVLGQLAPRLRPFPNGTTAMRALAATGSERPIGCTQLTEILNTPGLVAVGPLPEGYGLATVYTAAIGEHAAAPAVAERFVALLTGAATGPIRHRLGFR
jgi:molybdate transport system substrate-binding protein